MERAHPPLISAADRGEIMRIFMLASLMMTMSGTRRRSISIECIARCAVVTQLDNRMLLYLEMSAVPSYYCRSLQSRDRCFSMLAIGIRTAAINHSSVVKAR